jgi:uncharacterized membrane protein YGL010W
MSRRIDELLSEYGESHQDETNKAIHWICVPLIFFSIIGLLASLPSSIVQSFLGDGNPYANWAGVAMIFVIVYYVSLSIPLSIGMMLFGVLCLIAANAIVRLDVAPLWQSTLKTYQSDWA